MPTSPMIARAMVPRSEVQVQGRSFVRFSEEYVAGDADGQGQA